MKYFYIICRDKQILEIPFSENAYKTATEELVKKGIMAIRPKGKNVPVIINSVDVSKILDEETYNDYIHSVKPQEFILNGTWRDGKERRVLRYEKWKELEVAEQQKQLTETFKEKSSSDKIDKKIEEIRDKLSKKLACG